MARFTTKLAGGLIGLTLCASSTVSIASTTVRGSVSPLVALSALGSDASRTALCASTGAAAVGAAGAAVAAQGTPAPGCVLPVVDAPPPVPVAEVAPPVVAEPAYVASAVSRGIPTALLIGLPAALVGLGLLALLSNDDDDDDGSPISPQ